jgi:hypothetical protein
VFPWSYDAAFLACMMTNMMRAKNAKVVSVGDFMPADQPIVDPLAKTWETLRALSKDKRYGGRIDSNGKHNGGNREV